jgi:hypothetical protein
LAQGDLSEYWWKNKSNSAPMFAWQEHTRHDDGLPLHSSQKFVSLVECLQNAFFERFGEFIQIMGD